VYVLPSCRQELAAPHYSQGVLRHKTLTSGSRRRNTAACCVRQRSATDLGAAPASGMPVASLRVSSFVALESPSPDEWVMPVASSATPPTESTTPALAPVRSGICRGDAENTQSAAPKVAKEKFLWATRVQMVDSRRPAVMLFTGVDDLFQKAVVASSQTSNAARHAAA